VNDSNLPQWATLPGLLERLNGRTTNPAGGKKLLISVPGFFRWIEQQPSRRVA
jgi:hypothetical protein